MMSIDPSSAPLSAPTEAADDLTATNTPDLMANEQTWPTEEEMGEASRQAGLGGGNEPRRTKRVPKGTSAYQAAWIFDDEDDEAEAEEEDEEDEDGMEVEGGRDGPSGVAEEYGRDGDEDEEETELIELDSRRSEAHRDLDPAQEERE
jgi:pre-rRNA-processing protein TSR1